MEGEIDAGPPPAGAGGGHPGQAGLGAAGGPAVARAGQGNVCKKICAKLGIESVTTTRLEVKCYRKLVTKACHSKNEENLRKASESIKKCERIAFNKYGKQEYFSEKNLENARNMFKTIFGMTDLAGNFKNYMKFKLSSHLCKCKKRNRTPYSVWTM